MATQIYQLKETLVSEFPEKKHQKMLFEILEVMTGISWDKVKENTIVSPAIIRKSMKIVNTIFRKEF